MSTLLDQPANRHHAWLAIIATIGIWLTLLNGAYVWAQHQLSAGFPLKQAPLAIQLPKFMPVNSTVHNQLTAELDHTLEVNVPIDQWVTAVLPKRIHADVDLKTEVDLITTIQYQAVVPIHTVFEMETPIDHPLIPFRIPVKLPIAIDVPVNLSIPINHKVPVNLQTHIIAKINDPVPARFVTTLKSHVPIKTHLDTTVVSNAQAHLMFPTAPIQLNLENADLNIAINDISLVRSSLGFPNTNKIRPIDRRDLVFVYDANKKPPTWPTTK